MADDDGEQGQPLGGYRLNRIEVERKGRWISVYRCLWGVVLLFALQLTPWLVARGELSSNSPIDAWVPVRLSLLIDFVMVGAYVLLAYRAVEVVKSARAPRMVLPGTWFLFGVLAISGLLDLFENAWLWLGVTGQTDYPVSMTLWYSEAMRLFVVSGLIAILLVAWVSSPGFWWTREGNGTPQLRSGWRMLHRLHRPEGWAEDKKRWRSVLMDPVVEKPPEALNGNVICCSGGGIRSAAFCLGGLQTLTEEGYYQKARAVVGVSGGGYVAAAYHVARWKSGDDWLVPPDEQVASGLREPAAFAPASPEMRWLRRHTRYLMESPQVATLGALSLLFGITINLIWVIAVLGASAWWLGWFLSASGGLVNWGLADASGGTYVGDWRWVGRVWLLPASGVALFVVERMIERFVVLPHGVREMWRRGAVYVLWSGLAATLLLVGVPNLMEWIHDSAVKSDNVLAGLAHQLGLVPDAAGGAGAALPVTFLTVVASILAVVKAAQDKWGSGASEGKGAVRSFVTKAWVTVRRTLLPWTAVTIIVLAALLLEMRWIAALVATPSLLGRWELALWAGVVLFAIWLFTDVNRTSLHHFYRERLSYAFFVRRNGKRVEPLHYREALRFSESAPPADRGPELVSCAVANVSDVEYVPTSRNCSPFIFDHQHIGLTDRSLPSGPSLTDSATYEWASDFRARDATVAAAIAISGAAFSPLAGRQSTRVGPYRAVLALANARLGVWLPNPLWVDPVKQARRLVKRRHPDAVRANGLLSDDESADLKESLTDSDDAWLSRERTRQAAPPPQQPAVKKGGTHLLWSTAEYVRTVLSKPGSFRLGKEAVGKTSVLDRRLYVTDGGHYDNLGLVEALRRRPKEIFVLDASADPEDSFKALGEAIATARMDLDVEINLNPRKMRRRTTDRAEVAWATGHATYPDGEVTDVKLVKVVMLDDLPWDTEVYQKTNSTFPRTSTGNQLYGEFDLEAYRILGREVTRRLLHPPPPKIIGAPARSANGSGAKAQQPHTPVDAAPALDPQPNGA